MGSFMAEFTSSLKNHVDNRYSKGNVGVIRLVKELGVNRKKVHQCALFYECLGGMIFALSYTAVHSRFN